MANTPVPISTRTAATAVADTDLFGLYKAATGLWGKLTGAVLRDQLLNRLTSLGDFASGGSIGACDAWEIANVAQTTAWKALTIDAPTNLLSQQKVIRNTGTAGFFMYGRYIRPGGAHTFTYVPSVGWRRTASSSQRILQTAVYVTAPADTNTNSLLTFTLPAGLLGQHGQVYLEYFATTTSNANAKTFSLTANDGGDITMASDSSPSTSVARGSVNVLAKNLTNAQECTHLYQTSTTQGANRLATALDTTLETVWNFNITKATAGDAVILRRATVDIVLFD